MNASRERALSVCVRTVKASASLPGLVGNSENGRTPALQDPAANNDGEISPAGVVATATGAGAAAERRDSGVTLAGKRAAMRREREKAEEKSQAQVGTTRGCRTL